MRCAVGSIMALLVVVVTSSCGNAEPDTYAVQSCTKFTDALADAKAGTIDAEAFLTKFDDALDMAGQSTELEMRAVYVLVASGLDEGHLTAEDFKNLTDDFAATCKNLRLD